MKIAQWTGALALVVAAGSAVADPIITFGYTDLAGSYAAATNTMGTFNANAVAQPGPGGLRSDGNVTRLIGPGPALGTANFGPGFVNGPSAADFTLSISVLKAAANSTFAVGGGSFTMTDTNGDTIGGLVSGTWVTFGGATFFNGLLSGVTVGDVSNDGQFNGNIGSFGLGDLPAVMEGALVQIFLNPPNGFFNANFDNIDTGISGQLIPTPGSLALLGLGGLVAARRRRN